jgi:hypothetical protein
MHDIPIILTATIKPHSSPGIVNVTQLEHDRYCQYRRALTYVCRSQLFHHIIFADNSRSHLFHQIAAYATSVSTSDVKVSAVSYPIERESLVSGKGYGEGWLLSEVLARQTEEQRPSSFFKATGRYRIRNLRRVVDLTHRFLTERKEFDLICQDFVSHGAGRYSASTTFFWCKTAVWQRFFSNIYAQVNDQAGVFFEHVFADAIRRIVLQDEARIATLTIPLLIESTDTKFSLPVTATGSLYQAIIRTHIAHLLGRRRELKVLTAADVA